MPVKVGTTQSGRTELIHLHYNTNLPTDAEFRNGHRPHARSVRLGLGVYWNLGKEMYAETGQCEGEVSDLCAVKLT